MLVLTLISEVQCHLWCCLDGGLVKSIYTYTSERKKNVGYLLRISVTHRHWTAAQKTDRRHLLSSQSTSCVDVLLAYAMRRHHGK